MRERPTIFSTDSVKAILDNRKTQTRRVVKHVNQCPGNWTLDVEYQSLNQAFGSSHVHFLCKNPKPNTPYSLRFHCPYGQVGDRLWVRETWDYIFGDEDDYYIYKADDESLKWFNECKKQGSKITWNASTFMPRWVSRITLEITEVRVERLQEITETDAIAEGIVRYPTKIRQGVIYQALADYTYEAYPLKWGFKQGERLKADYPSLGLARFYSIDKKDGQCIHLSPKEAFSLLEDETMTYQEAFATLWNSLNAKHGYGWDTNPWVWVISFKRLK